MVGFTAVIHNTALANLLTPELSLGAEVVAIIVAKVIVTGNRQRLDTSVHEVLCQNTFHFRLTCLEVITTDEGLVALSKLNGTRHKRVLRSTINVRYVFKNACNGKDSRG